MQPCLELHLPACTRVSPYAPTNPKPAAEPGLGLRTQPSAHPPSPDLSNTEAYPRDPDSSEPRPGQLWLFRVLAGEQDLSVSWSALVMAEETRATCVSS